jgi:hypothetical protein
MQKRRKRRKRKREYSMSIGLGICNTCSGIVTRDGYEKGGTAAKTELIGGTPLRAQANESTGDASDHQHSFQVAL